MSLAPGARLGSHEIVGLLGAGGMGEVYLAHDTRLNRRVAIKVLPEAYANDAERVARFHREAQAVAALNHSGIAAIYDLAEADGTKFLVLELIEGDTLADRLQRGPIPIEEALEIAKQILEALEAAHERGVCHRDLKPANIKLTADGNVKVLDFGLAKFLQNAPSSPHLTHSPTLSLAGTYPGVILGTAGYMSPEQAKGHEADQRSDIFSFGCILYELLTGRKAFEGESASEILASVLKSDVEWSALPPRLNPRLVEVLKRCLEKNPKKRWHAAADVRVEIESIIGRGVVPEEAPAALPASVPLWKLVLSAALLMIATAAVAGYAVWTLKPPPPAAVTRFAIALPDGQVLTHAGRQALALSADGTQLVYTADNRLFHRELLGFGVRSIPGSDGAVNPVFSPDGKYLAFRTTSDGLLKRLALTGGAPVTIAAIAQPSGMSWHETAIVIAQPGKGIVSVSPNGGVPEVIAAAAENEVFDSPQLLPDGRGLMFAVRKSSEIWDQAKIVVQPRGSRERRIIIDGGADGRYLPSGHLAYVTAGVVLVISFNLQTLTVSGSPVPLVDGVRRGAVSILGGTAPGNALFAVSQNGLLAYLPGPANPGTSSQTDLGLFNRKGSVEPLKLPLAPYRSPRVSRDGRWVAFESSDGNNAFVAVHEIAGRGVPRRLTFEGNNRFPLWSVDGQWIVFQSDRAGDAAIFRTRADGSGVAERLTTPEPGTSHVPESWSPDGEHLMIGVERGVAFDQSRLWTLSLKDKKLTAFVDTPARDAVISPDGRWVAYGARTPAPGLANQNQVFVEPFPRTGAKYLVPIPAGHPVWSPSGNELIVGTGAIQNHAVPVYTATGFSFGPPHEFPRAGRAEASPAITRRQLDVMPDGRVLGVMGQALGQEAARAEILVVTNWFDEVRQRVPVP